MPWFANTESCERCGARLEEGLCRACAPQVADAPPLPVLIACGGNHPPPALLEDSAVNLQTVPAIKDIVANGTSIPIEAPDLTVGAWLIVASFFLPLLAREDRIAAWFSLPVTDVRRMGFRLRRAGIWVRERLADDCYADVMSDDPLTANFSLILFAGVAHGRFAAWREGGKLLFGLPEWGARYPVHIEGMACPKCWTHTKYGQTGVCVECQRRRVRKRKPSWQPTLSDPTLRP